MNMSTICPPFLTVLMNIYSESSDLILGTCTLQSQEGTTQGDPLAMPFYALATRPLIDALDKGLPDLRRIWYADDATAVGKALVGKVLHDWTFIWLLCKPEQDPGLS